MRKTRDFVLAGLTTIALVAGVPALVSCGTADKPSAATSSANAKSRKAHTPSALAKPGQEEVSDMVAAVSSSKPGPPVELKFVLTSRPEVGQVMDVDVAVVPRAPVPDSVSVAFQVADGLDIVDGSQLERVEKLVDGTPVRHVVKLIPKRDGIFAMTAVVTFTSASLDSTRTFTIPVIAGQGLPEQVAKGP